MRGTDRRVVLVFTGTRRGIWGKNPATAFGKAFRSANAGTHR